MLTLIQTRSCPVCDAPAVGESIETDERGRMRRHVNGERWERRRFSCGHEIGWIPNFSREQELRPCPNKPELLDRHQKRSAGAAAIIAFVADLDVDEDFKNYISRRVRDAAEGYLF